MFREKRMYGQDPNTVLRSKTKFLDPLKWTDEKAAGRTLDGRQWSEFPYAAPTP